MNANYALRWKIGAVCLASGLLVLATLAGCTRPAASAGDNQPADQGNSNPAARRVETVLVEQRELVRTVEMPGTVEGFESADLYAKVGGYLQDIHVDIGDHITKRQALAQLYVPEMAKELAQKQAALLQAEAEIAQAQAVVEKTQADLASFEAALDEAKTELVEKQAKVDFRQSDFNRVQDLVNSQAVRRELLDQAQFQLDSANAGLQSVQARIRTASAKLAGARAELEKVKADVKAAEAHRNVVQANVEHVQTLMQYATIRAPFDGVVTDRHVHPGAFIHSADKNSAARPLLSVARIDKVRIKLDIPMNDVRLLELGDRAVLSKINALPGESFEGQVTRFSPGLDPSSRMKQVEIDLENPGGRLLPGYYGYVTVYLEELNTPTIPSTALLTEGNQAYCYVCRDGQAVRRDLDVSYQDGTWVGVASGLQAGEQVVRAGGSAITDGQAVTAVLADLNRNRVQ